MSIATDLAGVRKNLLAIRDCKGKTQCVNLLASSCEGLSTIVGNKAIDRRSVDGRKFLTEIEAGLNTLQGVRNGIEEALLTPSEAKSYVRRVYNSISSAQVPEIKSAAVSKEITENSVRVAINKTLAKVKSGELKVKGFDPATMEISASELDIDPKQMAKLGRELKQALKDNDDGGYVVDVKSDDETRRQLDHLREFRKVLPNKMAHTYSVVEMPIIPIYGDYRLSNPEVLKKAGFDCVRFSSEDLEGYVVLKKQSVLMIDYQRYLKSHEESIQEDLEIADTEYRKALAKWKLKKKEWDERHAEYEAKMAEYEEALDKFNSRLEKWNKTPEGQRKAKPTMKLKPPAEIEEFEIPRPPRPKAAKPLAKDELDQLAEMILNKLNQHLSNKVALVSEHGVANVKNPQIMCYWISEQWKINALQKVFGSGATAEEWGFPF